MKLTSRPLLFHLLLFCATQTSGVEIQSVPAVNADGVIETELEKSVSLVCQPDGGHDPPVDDDLVWLRNGAIVSLRKGNRKGRSSVCVTPVTYDDDGATFSCHLRENATFTASVTLNVTYHPQLSGSEDVAVEEEAELVLRCDILAKPPISSVFWTLNGSMVDLLAGGFSLAVDGFASQLAAAFVEKSVHEGAYRCTATSPLYGEYSKQFSVTVTEKTFKFPLMPTVAGVVVVCLTALFAVVSRWNRIRKVEPS